MYWREAYFGEFLGFGQCVLRLWLVGMGSTTYPLQSLSCECASHGEAKVEELIDGSEERKK